MQVKQRGYETKQKLKECQVDRNCPQHYFFFFILIVTWKPAWKLCGESHTKTIVRNAYTLTHSPCVVHQNQNLPIERGVLELYLTLSVKSKAYASLLVFFCAKMLKFFLVLRIALSIVIIFLFSKDIHIMYNDIRIFSDHS